jgi:hypothetical protein
MQMQLQMMVPVCTQRQTLIVMAFAQQRLMSVVSVVVAAYWDALISLHVTTMRQRQMMMSLVLIQPLHLKIVVVSVLKVLQPIVLVSVEVSRLLMTAVSAMMIY